MCMHLCCPTLPSSDGHVARKSMHPDTRISMTKDSSGLIVTVKETMDIAPEKRASVLQFNNVYEAASAVEVPTNRQHPATPFNLRACLPVHSVPPLPVIQRSTAHPTTHFSCAPTGHAKARARHRLHALGLYGGPGRRNGDDLGKPALLLRPGLGEAKVAFRTCLPPSLWPSSQ